MRLPFPNFIRETPQHTGWKLPETTIKGKKNSGKKHSGEILEEKITVNNNRALK